jgi:SAM-dependent methyltransferase
MSLYDVASETLLVSMGIAPRLSSQEYYTMPKLEIGPGKKRQPGFTTVDVSKGADVDYVCNASGKVPMPFPDNHFEWVFASHILEHIPWYETEIALKEWVRVLKPGGTLEVRVPNGYKIAKAVVDFEEKGDASGMKEDGWYRNNEHRSPYLWGAGRIFTYGDGKGNVNHPNWHRALFTPKYLMGLFKAQGLKKIRMLNLPKEARGPSHGWIDMGAVGVK